jgi:hypothetical protein
MYEAEIRRDLNCVLSLLADNEEAGDGNVDHCSDVQAGWDDVSLKTFIEALSRTTPVLSISRPRHDTVSVAPAAADLHGNELLGYLRETIELLPRYCHPNLPLLGAA